jgi:poly(beta-D-mannuronate) lyase
MNRFAVVMSALVLGGVVVACKTAAVAPVSAPPQQALQSPWDTHPVTPVQLAYACGPVLAIAPGIGVIDSDYRPTGDVPTPSDSVYAASSKAVADLSARVARAADAFQSTGNREAAVCVGTLLASAADEHSMAGWMFSDAAVFEQSKGLRAVAIAYLKVRNSGVLAPGENGLILAWLHDIASQEIRFYDNAGCRDGACDMFNHRAASGAFAVAAAAIATNDRGMFHWSEHKGRSIIDHIGPDGFLEKDFVWRWTLSFHLESAAALTQLAEFSELNGDPMFAYDNGALHRLIHTATNGIVDPGHFVLATHVRQQMPRTLEGWEIGWATIYVRRFPDPLISSLLKQANDAGDYAWGGAPFGAEQGS